jgi:hypothetical protein
VHAHGKCHHALALVQLTSIGRRQNGTRQSIVLYAATIYSGSSPSMTIIAIVHKVW